MQTVSRYERPHSSGAPRQTISVCDLQKLERRPALVGSVSIDNSVGSLEAQTETLQQKACVALSVSPPNSRRER